eukprot:m.386935 g.386935  ORF g.386935 m.386935 type:complete len:345 (+) comp21026_c0_seq6:187-1221(+)
MASKRSLKEKMQAETADPLTKTVIKATDSDPQPPKQKHLTALIGFTFHPEINLRDMASKLVERSKQKSWAPVLKTLVTTHRLLRDANVDFADTLHAVGGPFQLGYFTDTSTSDAPTISIFIQRYSLYLNQKVQSTKKMGFDYCHCKSASRSEALATDGPPAIFEKLESILDLMSAILDLAEDGSMRSIIGNFVVREAASMLFKDVMRLWVCANAASCNILERYFSMTQRQAQVSLRLYETFVKQCGRTDKFVEICNLVMGDSTSQKIPPLGDTPRILLPKLKEYLKQAKGSPSTPRREMRGSQSSSSVGRGGGGGAMGDGSLTFVKGSALQPVDPSVNPDNPFL